VKYCLLAVGILVLAGAAWAVHVASVQRRADELRLSADEACRRFDFVTAQRHLAAYLELRPADASTHLLAARCARRAEFIEDFEGPDSELRARASQRLDDAERLGAEPAALALERTLGRAQHGELSDTERTLVDSVKAGGADAPLILESLIHAYLRHLQFEKALMCVDSLLKLEPENVLALLWRGRMREQSKQARDASEDYELAVRLNPDFDAARYYLAEMLLRSNQVSDAAAHLQVLNTRTPDNLLVRLAWARCRIAMGEEASGQDLLDAWLKDAPKNHSRLLEALRARAGLALASGSPEEAEGFARRALQEAPLDPYALHDLARSLSAQGRGPEAHAIEEQVEKIKQDLRVVARCRERLNKNPADLELRHELGAAYLRVGRPDEALVWLNSVLDRDPKHRPTLQTLADYHAQAGNPTLAAEMRRRLGAGP
jgi:predicted Zn-dependent protease